MIRLQGSCRVVSVQGTWAEVRARLAEQGVVRLKATLDAGVGCKGLCRRRRLLLSQDDNLLPLFKLIVCLFEKIGNRAIDL